MMENDGPSTRKANTFSRAKIKSVYKGDGSLRIFGRIVWNNMLPDNLKVCSSLSEFKNKVKTWIPDNCPCRLSKMYIKNIGFVTIAK